MFEKKGTSQAQHAEVYERYKSGANWFYWIAGLSLITSIVTFSAAVGVSDQSRTYSVFRRRRRGMSTEFGGAPQVIALVLDIFVTALFVLFGMLAGNENTVGL